MPFNPDLFEHKQRVIVTLGVMLQYPHVQVTFQEVTPIQFLQFVSEIHILLLAYPYSPFLISHLNKGS